uniref:STAS domain-containing protein n=1 Tax=Denticeps clupeoides TaxID=299321 RepID=A0AAY4DM58_9TELE
MSPEPSDTLYSISRPVYSTPTFEHDHERQERAFIVSLLDLILLPNHYRCSGKGALRVLKSHFPVIDWLSKYPAKEWFISDLISGVSTGLVCSLQGMAYALLVSVAPVYGLYSAFFPILTYFLLGTSRHISVGPFPVTCLMVGSVVLTLVPNNPTLLALNGTVLNDTDLQAKRIVVASTMTVLVGLFQLAMGFLQVGFLVRYLSEPLVGGFTTAAAMHVFVSQISIILSVSTGSYNGPFSMFKTLSDVFSNIHLTNIADLVAGLLTIVVVVTVKEVSARFQHKISIPIPIEVLVTMLAAGISYAADLHSIYGASIVSEIPMGFIPVQPPNTELFWDILGPSLSTAIVGYAVAVSVAKVYASKYDYTINGNQELLAFGVSNIFCGFFSSFVSSTALSRTAVQESTGGKTQVAGIVSAVLVMIVILALGNLLEPLQKSVLAGIVIANLKGMFLQMTEVPSLWRKNGTDCYIWIATFVACVVLGLDVGLLAGLGFEMATVVIRTQFPACSALGNVPGTDIYRNISDYKNVRPLLNVSLDAETFWGIYNSLGQIINAIFSFVQYTLYFVSSLHILDLRLVVSLFAFPQDSVVSVVSLGLDNEGFESDRDLELEKRGGGQDPVVDVKVDWALELPVRVSVPRVHIHSLVLDFSAVSFLDVVAVKSLRLVIKEFVRIGVSVYIAGCDGKYCWPQSIVYHLVSKSHTQYVSMGFDSPHLTLLYTRKKLPLTHNTFQGRVSLRLVLVQGW